MAKVFFKAIKPKRMKEDEIRLALLSGLNKIAREVKKDFQLTVKTWNTKPKFSILLSLKDGPSFIVGTDDETYRLVNDGAKPHPIAPKSPTGVLSFPGMYSPKTVPGVIGSKNGGKSGTIRKAKKVMHPGHEARNFEDTIYEKWKTRFIRRMEEALREGVRRSGHSVK